MIRRFRYWLGSRLIMLGMDVLPYKPKPIVVPTEILYSDEGQPEGPL